MMDSLGAAPVRWALVLGCLAAVGCEPTAAPPTAPPVVGAPPVVPVASAPSKDAQAWELGNRLSLAALGNAEQGPSNAINNVFAKAQASAGELGVPPLPPLPGRTANRARGGADAINYLLNTAGAPIARSLEDQSGRRASLLFQISLKANLLLLLYEPSPNNREAGAIVDFVATKAAEIALPKELWEPLVNQVRSQSSYDQVKAAVRQFQERVHAYLQPAGGQAAPPPVVVAGKPSPAAPTSSSPPPTVPQLQAGQQYLRTLPPTRVEAIGGPEHAIDHPFELQKVMFRNGVYVHPPLANSTGRATYSLGQNYARLRGAAGVNDHRFGKAWSPLTFRVLGDGKALWTSKALQTCGDWEAFDIDLTGVKELTLEVQCPGDHTGAHGSWMDPILVSAAR